jgi:hypothetical protein
MVQVSSGGYEADEPDNPFSYEGPDRSRNGQQSFR